LDGIHGIGSKNISGKADAAAQALVNAVSGLNTTAWNVNATQQDVDAAVEVLAMVL
jgi:hypothetical protein